MSAYVLAIDQGTTSTRAIVLSDAFEIVASAQQEFRQYFPQSGWVEHDPEEIWDSTVATCRRALEKAGLTAKDIAAIGITNQRETTIVWDRKTGKPIHRAIVWQDRRTAELCSRLAADGHNPMIAAKTGLLLDAYFSGTKISWLLDQRRRRPQNGRGRPPALRHRRHLSALAADRRPAARHRRHQRLPDPALQYPREPLGRGTSRPAAGPRRDAAGGTGLLRRFRPDGGLRPSAHAIPVRGIAGDQQAALVGQACFQPGMIKSTYGTGCFIVLNTGDEAVGLEEPPAHHHRLPAGRQDHLRPRRFDLRGRGRRPVDARRHGPDRGRLRDRQAGPQGRYQPGCLPGPGLHRPRRPLLGPGCPRRHLRHHPGHRAGRTVAGGPRVGLLPDPRPARGDARRLAGIWAKPCCGSTAA